LDTTAHTPQNLEERLIWRAITGTWVVYLFGGLYLLAPLIGWYLIGVILWRAYSQNETTPPRQRIRIFAGPLYWTIGMFVLLFALILGHIDFHLPISQLIKSSLGWAKGWALMAIFITIGASLDIRPRVLARAGNRLALQTLCMIPIFQIAPLIHIPGHFYVSPLLMLGGPGPEFFSVDLYSVSFASPSARWSFFSPWAPAAGVVANVYLIIALQDRSVLWKTIGITSCICICWMSQSRLALIALVAVPAISVALSSLTRPSFFFAGAFAATTAGLLIEQLLEFMDAANAKFVAARAASSRVRATLGHIALQRWQDEAPIFGHGAVERGPHVVEYMPIGSHHTWYGLLFVKGAIGFASLAIPMFASFVELILKAQTSRTARGGLAILITLLFYTFGENLEILVYQFWPGLLLIGRASRQHFHSPLGRTFESPANGGTSRYQHN
jgi:hypothetical protein